MTTKDQGRLGRLAAEGVRSESSTPPGEPKMSAVILPGLAEEPEVEIGGGIFAYRYTRATDHPTATAWWLEFYRRFRFVAFTIPAETP